MRKIPKRLPSPYWERIRAGCGKLHRNGSEIHDVATDLQRGLTTPAQAKQFVVEAEVDTLAPAVGNMQECLALFKSTAATGVALRYSSAYQMCAFPELRSGMLCRRHHGRKNQSAKMSTFGHYAWPDGT